MPAPAPTPAPAPAPTCPCPHPHPHTHTHTHAHTHTHTPTPAPPARPHLHPHLLLRYFPYLHISPLSTTIRSLLRHRMRPLFPYTAIAEPLSLLSIDAPPPVFLPISYILPTIHIPLWYTSLTLHSSLHSQCTVSPQHCTVVAQQCTVHAQLLRLRLPAQPPLSVVYKSSLLYDQSLALVFSYFSQYRTLNPFSIPSPPLRSIVHSHSTVGSAKRPSLALD